MGRWVRLALPAYLLIMFAATIFPYFGAGPAFLYIYRETLQEGIQEYWWSWLLFIQNWAPWSSSVGVYWIYYIANDLQFYACVLCPSLYFYLKRCKRHSVIIFLSALILLSVLYLFSMTLTNSYSSILNFD